MRRHIVPMIAIAMVAVACGGGGSGAPSTAADPTTTTSVAAADPTPAPSGVTVTVVDSALGSILADGDGNTLYVFEPDGRGESTCYEGCAAAWPPLTGDVTAGAGADPSLLGATTRTDGSSQVTYGGWPLYYYSGDAAPGDVNGQGVNGVWYVVSATGDEVRSGGTSEPAAGPGDY